MDAGSPQGREGAQMLGVVGPGNPPVRDFWETRILPSLVPRLANTGNNSALVVPWHSFWAWGEGLELSPLSLLTGGVAAAVADAQS